MNVLMMIVIIPIGWAIGWFGSGLFYWLVIDKRKHSYWAIQTCRDIK